MKGRGLVISMVTGMLGVLLVLTNNAQSFALFSRGGFASPQNLPVLLSELAVLGAAALSALAMRIARQSVAEIPVAELPKWQVGYGGIFIALTSRFSNMGNLSI